METKFWDLAKEIYNQLVQALVEKTYFLSSSVYEAFLNPEFLKANGLTGDMPAEFNISNIGKYKFNPYYSDGKNEYKVDKLYCSTANAVPLAAQYAYLCMAVDYHTYTLVCNEKDTNYKLAMKIFTDFHDLHEQCHKLDD
eukprot:CAMPEP_0170567054 /NCGR_PEP_ID=MMETSP0211-20121228/80237_1 /TAXON_ID=311385 /ORGANISM="Pseudokeronopsis sp., Strain OXSARD2" /LENGTH=139 /DNA_ID=CAMNT_0010888405 /DNA_START=411 /DNA_END=827 /DNA_ORIENTATION=-